MSAPVVEVEESNPIVDALQTLDSQYTELQAELNKTLTKLRVEFLSKVAPILAKRKEVLNGSTASETGTPAIPDFWLEVLANSQEFGQLIMEHDVPVLKYLDDITCENLVKEDDEQGFKVIFTFKSNPYFENTVVTKTVRVSKTLEYMDHIEIDEIVSDELKWKAGMDVTVEVKQKKKSGGGAKKKGASATVPRPSFFREVFRSLGPDHPVPDLMDDEDEEEDQDEDEVLEMYLSQDYELCCALRDFIVPHAVKWYTGEAVDDEEDYDDDEDDDEEEVEGKPKKGGKKTQEDCKQQ